jgi:hypothetical protein
MLLKSISLILSYFFIYFFYILVGLFFSLFMFLISNGCIVRCGLLISLPHMLFSDHGWKWCGNPRGTFCVLIGNNIAGLTMLTVGFTQMKFSRTQMRLSYPSKLVGGNIKLWDWGCIISFEACLFLPQAQV